MQEITRTREALRAIKKRGWLNSFSTPGDSWFVAHSVPGGQSEDAVLIASSIALGLIESGKVERADGQWLLGSGATAGAWYRPKER